MARILNLLIVLICSPLLAQAEGYAYVGADNCKICHNSSKKGSQYGVWNKAGHAQSMETLKSEKALALAKERGLETLPYESGECLVCHATGWEQPDGYVVLSAEFIADPANARAVKKNLSKANVGCEMCHGAGGEYKSKKNMDAVFAGTVEPAAVGLVIPKEQVCLACHNENNPTHPGFDFETMVAKIAHPYPDEFRATRGRDISTSAALPEP